MTHIKCDNATFKEELKNYGDGLLNLTPIANILMNDHTKDWYVEIGKYILKVFKPDELPDTLPFRDEIKKLVNNKTKIGRVLNFLGKSPIEERIHSSLGIFFVTASLDNDTLNKLWGEPLWHREFGEGGKGMRRGTFASYFVEINGTKFHIGFDERGTSMEVELQTAPQTLFSCIEDIIDEVKKVS